MIKPPGAQRHVALRRYPVRGITMTRGEDLEIGHSRVTAIQVERVPGWIGGEARFVPHPADVRTSIAEDNGIGLQRANIRPDCGPVIVVLAIHLALLPRATVIAVPTRCAVE